MTVAYGRDLPTSFQAALKSVREVLSSNHELVRKDLVDAEAEQIVLAAFRLATGQPLSRVELFTRIQDRYPDAAGARALEMAGGRAAGKPLQHLIGTQAFLDHEYVVNRSVLVPRPETEFLVIEAIERLKSMQPKLGLEIGVGSGVISIELLSAFPSLQMIASEASPDAAKVAEQNAVAILGEPGARRLRIVSAAADETVEPLSRALDSGRADFLITNPPYLDRADEIDVEVLQHEPEMALFPRTSDPLYFYRSIAQKGPQQLHPGGLVFAELAHERATETLNLFEFPLWDAKILKDLTGRGRVLVAQLK